MQALFGVVARSWGIGYREVGIEHEPDKMPTRSPIDALMANAGIGIAGIRNETAGDGRSRNYPLNGAENVIGCRQAAHNVDGV